MNRLFKFIMGIFAGCILVSCTVQTEPEALVLVPYPDQLELTEGHFKITGHTRVYVSEDDPLLVSTAKYFIEKLDMMFGMTLETGSTNDPGNSKQAVILVLDGNLTDLGQEGYHLDVTPDQVVVKAKTNNGIFYGIQTLIQVIHSNSGEAGNRKISIPALRIVDKPVLEWRGMHLDVSRHFFDKEFIKKYLDILAAHKMNVLHWHLTDDQGWRIEIKKYPELTNLAAWRVDHTDKPWNYEVEITNDPGKKLYGGYYSQEDIREIVDYARQRFITIVPEIEMPGHSQAALTAYPHLSCSGKPYVKPDVPFEFTDPYCAGNDSTFIFLEDVLLEVMDMFPSEYIHVGGDEAKKTPWIHCSKCQALMKREGLTDVDQLQSYFIRKIDAFLEDHGRKLIGWDEILEGGLAPGAAVMSWRGERGGIRAAMSGHKVVMTPSGFLYFNRMQDVQDPDSPARGLQLQDVYQYNPVPENLAEENRKFIMGVQACLWTENTQKPERAELQLLPRLAALSEIAWTSPEKRSWTRFHDQLLGYYSYLDRLGTNYFVPAPTGLESRVFYQEQCEISMDVDLGNTEIRYTLDGSDPEGSSTLYQGPFSVSGNTVIAARTFLPNGKFSHAKRVSIRKEPLRDAMPGETKFEPGLKYVHYSGSISSLDQFELLVPADSGITGNFIIPMEPEQDLYGFEFTGMIRIGKEGVYSFTTDSDDGSRLYVNDELIVDNDGIHGAHPVSGQIPLKAGFHPVRLMFFENLYGQHLKVWIEGPETGKTIIPDSLLYH